MSKDVQLVDSQTDTVIMQGNCLDTETFNYKKMYEEHNSVLNEMFDELMKLHNSGQLNLFNYDKLKTIVDRTNDSINKPFKRD